MKLREDLSVLSHKWYQDASTSDWGWRCKCCRIDVFYDGDSNKWYWGYPSQKHCNLIDNTDSVAKSCNEVLMHESLD